MEALKVVSFLTRRADFSLAEFSQYWRTTHKDHALKLVEAGFFRGYVQNHVLEPGLDGLARMADGAPELWIDDLGALQRLIDSPQYREGAGPDEARFMIPPAISCVARERLVAGRRRSQGLQHSVKLMRVVRRHPDLAPEAFGHRWLAADESIWPATAPLLRLTRQWVEAGAGVDTEGLPFDGIECSWWPDQQSLGSVWQALAQTARTEALVEVGSVRGMLVREEVVQAPDENS